MTTEQSTLLRELQQIGLTVDDLREYLDTHTQDSNALSLFHSSSADYAAKAQQYSRRFSPLFSAAETGDSKNWLWALSDFPWING